MRKHKFLRRALAVLAACLLLGAACLAGLAKALPDTFYIDGALTDLKIAAMPFLSVAQPRQGSVAADNAVAHQDGARGQHPTPHGAGLWYAVWGQNVLRRGTDCGVL